MTQTDQPDLRPMRPRRKLPRPVRAIVDMGRDLGLAALTLAFGVVSLVLPRRAYRLVVRVSARLATPFADDPRRRLLVEQTFCRGYGVFRRGWPADVEVTGLEHFHTAHAEGRGVVLWVMGFLDQTALTQVLADVGHPVTFLSSQNHGVYSNRAPSRYVAAPILIRAAIRSLDDIVVIPDDGNKSYVRKLCRILQKQQGTVGMKGDVTDQRGAVEATFRGQTVGFPSGAPSLAHMTGAPLLTGAVIRHDTLDHEVIIDEPITVPRNQPSEQFVRAVIDEFAHRLEKRAAANPTSRPATKFDKVRAT